MSNRFSISTKFGKLPKLPSLTKKDSDKPQTPERRDAASDLPPPPNADTHAQQQAEGDWSRTYSPRHTDSDRDQQTMGQRRHVPRSSRFQPATHDGDTPGTPRHTASGYRTRGIEPTQVGIVNSHPLYDMHSHAEQQSLLDSDAADVSPHETADPTASTETSNSTLTLADLAASETAVERSESLRSDMTDDASVHDATPAAPEKPQPPLEQGAPDNTPKSPRGTHDTNWKRLKHMKPQKKIAKIQVQPKPAEAPSALRQSLLTGHLHTNAEIEQHLGPRSHRWADQLKALIEETTTTHQAKSLVALMEILDRAGPTTFQTKTDRKQLLKPLLALCTDAQLSPEERQAVFQATLAMLPVQDGEDEGADRAHDLCQSMIFSLQDKEQRDQWMALYAKAAAQQRNREPLPPAPSDISADTVTEKASAGDPTQAPV